MTSFLVEFPRFKRDHNGFSVNLPKHQHSWVAPFERERARLAAVEDERRTRWDREDERAAWLRDKQRERDNNSKTVDPTVIAKPIKYDDPRRAHHEGAHIVLANVQGVNVSVASIDPDGRSESYIEIDDNATDEQRLLIFLGGREGELLGLGDAGDGDSSDLRHARDIALRLTGGDADAAEAKIRGYQAVANNLLSKHRSLVKALADALINRRTLDRDAINSVIDDTRAAASTRSSPSAASAASTTRSFTAANCPPHMRALFEQVHTRTDGWVL